MKKRMILWFMVLTLLLPLVSASTFASRTEIYDEYIEPMSDYDHFYLAKSDYGEMSFVLDTRNEVLGIATGFYPMSLTGQETKETLKAIAKELIEDGTPLLLGSNQYFTISYNTDLFSVSLDGKRLETGSYLFIAYMYSFKLKDGWEAADCKPRPETLYVTDIHVVEEPVACTGANFYLCDKYGENRQPVTELILDLDMKLPYFLVAKPTPFNATGAFYLDIIQLGDTYPVGAYRMVPTYMACGNPIWVQSCGTGTLGAVWRMEKYAEDYLLGPIPINVTVPCKPEENNVTVTRERTATQPGELTGPCKSCGAPATMDWAPIFTDTYPQEYYAPAVDYCYEQQLFRGTSVDKFSPSLAMRRGMVVTVLYRLAGSPDTTGLQSAFSDVAEGQYYTAPIKWASANGIVNGMGGGKFQPNTNVSREQIAAILYRYAQFTGMDTTVSGDGLTKFTDRDSISDYALAPMAWAVESGLINGITTTTLQPRGNALRAQVATIVYRYVNAVPAPV